ncbi:uncharacterized protein LOC126188654 [Schistocerca cancellata]|uniref:uncharacterized protein LOC126188654 n=1 Tax=Schistocerca cancellata TaxID=274614 RepID=UPI0021195EF5|nr:uncharacterized protein LOC126188654 [Schistocerca cancellata]
MVLVHFYSSLKLLEVKLIYAPSTSTIIQICAFFVDMFVNSCKDLGSSWIKCYCVSDKWIQRSVKRKSGSSSKGKENMVPDDGHPKGNELIGSNEELEYQVESESLALTAPHKPFVPKVPSGIVAPPSKKQNALSPARSKIMQSYDHSNDGSLKDLEDNLEDEGEESTLLLVGNHKQFVPKVPSNLMLNHSKKQNTSNISFHYVVEEIISEEYVQHSDK